MKDNRKYGSIMIDIETLSTHKNASIIEIAAVEFDEETGETGKTFDVLIDPNEWSKNDRHIDGSTIQWWMGQSANAQKRFMKNEDAKYKSLKDCLLDLKNFISDTSVFVWGNGASFDISILEDAYEYFNIEIPWKYYNVCDVRTIVKLNPKIKNTYKFIGVKHSAVDDCIYEIGYLTETLKTLTIKK